MILKTPFRRRWKSEPDNFLICKPSVSPRASRSDISERSTRSWALIFRKSFSILSMFNRNAIIPRFFSRASSNRMLLSLSRHYRGWRQIRCIHFHPGAAPEQFQCEHLSRQGQSCSRLSPFARKSEGLFGPCWLPSESFEQLSYKRIDDYFLTLLLTEKKVKQKTRYAVGIPINRIFLYYTRKIAPKLCFGGSEIRCMFVAWKTVILKRATTKPACCTTSYVQSNTEGKYLPTVWSKRSPKPVLEYNHVMTSTLSKSAQTATMCTCSYKAPPQHLPNKLFKQSRASRRGQSSNRIQRSKGCCGVESSGRKVTILTPSVSTQRQTSYETMSKIRGSSTQNYTKASRPCLRAWNRHFIPRQLAAR